MRVINPESLGLRIHIHIYKWRVSLPKINAEMTGKLNSANYFSLL